MLDRNLDFDVFDISSCISDSDRMHIMVRQSTITSARNNTFTEGNPESGTDIFFKSKRIKLFIEAQAFWRSYDSAPRPPPPPFPGSKLDRRHTGILRQRDNFLTGRGVMGAGVEPNNTTARSLGPLWSVNPLCFKCSRLLSVFPSKLVCYWHQWLAKLPTLVIGFPSASGTIAVRVWNKRKNSVRNVGGRLACLSLIKQYKNHLSVIQIVFQTVFFLFQICFLPACIRDKN